MDQEEEIIKEKNRRKILVVEDDPAASLTVQTKLEAEKFDVVTAFNGADALEAIRREKPDLIILDLILPDTSGYELSAKCKLDHFYDVPIIMLTSNHRETAKQLAYKCGVDVFIPKNLFQDRFISEVEKLLKEQEVEKI